MAPQELQLPGTRPTATKEATVDERSLAHAARTIRVEQDHQASEERQSCFYCVEG